MSWGTTFNCDIFLIRQSFQSKEELQIAINDMEDDIKRVESRLKMYAASAPKDITPEEWQEDIIGYVHSEISTLLQELSELHYELSNLRHFARVVEENPDKTPREYADF